MIGFLRYALLVACIGLFASPDSAGDTADQIRNELIGRSDDVQRFYESRNYHPAWIVGDKARDRAIEAVDAMRVTADLELPGNDYRFQTLQTLLKQSGNQNTSTEIQLTTSMLKFLDHRVNGRTKFRILHPDWKVEKAYTDPVNLLNGVLHATNVGEYLEKMPPSSQYQVLCRMLKQYILISQQGGWPTIPKGAKLSIGMSNERVVLIRKRLRITGDLEAANNSENEEFDSLLDLAVRNFQSRHGLNIDGVVGPATLTEMNRTVVDRIQQIQVNLERLRWLPDETSSRFVQVNIAAFQLHIFDSGKELLRMRTIVGQNDWCSPVFLSSEIREIILNPTWYVPRQIATKEILKFVKKDPQYLSKHRIRVFKGGTPIPPDSVDWRQVSARNLPFQFQQDPGPWNSLGRIKFQFPNNCGCYMHDTPAKELFSRSNRTFSHGCIRLENPLALSSFLLSGNSEWTPENVQEAIDSKSTVTIHVPEPVPLYLVYFTSWVDVDNKLHFARDVYEQDRLLAHAMES